MSNKKIVCPGGGSLYFARVLDEMAIRPEDSERMLDEILLASRPMLPRFFR